MKPSLGFTFTHAPWVPTMVGNTLRLWLRADLGLTQSANVVTAWSDQSGVGNHATIVSTPSYTASAVNGRPAVGCDGAGSGFSLSASGINIAGAHTAWLVFKTTGSASDANVFGQGTGGGGNFMTLSHHLNGTAFYYLNTGANNASIAKAGSGFDIVRISWDGTGNANGQSIAKNGGTAVTHTSTFTGAINTTTAYSIGVAKLNTSHWQGQLAELIFCNSKLSDLHIANNERYLRKHYGIAQG